MQPAAIGATDPHSAAKPGIVWMRPEARSTARSLPSVAMMSCPPSTTSASGKTHVLVAGTSSPVQSSSVPLPDVERRLIASGALPSTHFRSGGVFAAVERRPEAGGERLVLQRWDASSGEQRAEVTLLVGKVLAQQASADSRHLLLTTRVEHDSASLPAYLWNIYSLATGERVAQVRNDSSASPFWVAGSLLVHQAPPSGHRTDGTWVTESLRIRGRDLANGAEIWNRPLRTTAYRGPYPPQLPHQPMPPRDVHRDRP